MNVCLEYNFPAFSPRAEWRGISAILQRAAYSPTLLNRTLENPRNVSSRPNQHLFQCMTPTMMAIVTMTTDSQWSSVIPGPREIRTSQRQTLRTRGGVISHLKRNGNFSKHTKNHSMIIGRSSGNWCTPFPKTGCRLWSLLECDFILRHCCAWRRRHQWPRWSTDFNTHRSGSGCLRAWKVMALFPIKPLPKGRDKSLLSTLYLRSSFMNVWLYLACIYLPSSQFMKYTPAFLQAQKPMDCVIITSANAL